MVADDIIHSGVLHAAFDVIRMIKAFIAFRVHGIFHDRKQGVEFICHQQCIAHFVFGISRMDTLAVDNERGGGGIEILIFQFAECTSVYRVGKFRTEAFHIKMICAAADLLIGCKGDSDVSVRHFGMRCKS